MLTDALVVLVSTIIFKNIDVAIYSAFTIFCSGQVVDKIVVGMDVAKLIYVITDSPEKIQNHLVEKMDLGVTVLTGKGGFSQTEKGVLMLAVRRTMFSAHFQRSCAENVITTLKRAGAIFWRPVTGSA